MPVVWTIHVFDAEAQHTEVDLTALTEDIATALHATTVTAVTIVLGADAVVITLTELFTVVDNVDIEEQLADILSAYGYIILYDRIGSSTTTLSAQDDGGTDDGSEVYGFLLAVLALVVVSFLVYVVNKRYQCLRRCSSSADPSYLDHVVVHQDNDLPLDNLWD
jgi:hypothetical protein